MPQHSPMSLRGAIGGTDLADRRLLGARQGVSLGDVVQGSCLDVDRAGLAGRSVLVVTGDQLAAALALIELDGLARRLVVAPPDLSSDHLPAVIADAEVDTIVSDLDPATFATHDVPLVARCRLPIVRRDADADAGRATEWVLLTSGTTGVPKMVVHSLEGLTAAIRPVPPRARPMVWATFYDIRRYGGLQIFLRAMLAPSSLALSDAGEPVVDHLHRLADAGVTHISGTPSHWRRALMCGTAEAIAPEYVRLSGEIADQAILNALRETYPQATIGHAYASTEAGVGFTVDDGLEGFPASLVDRHGKDTEIRVEDGSLRIRSSRAASRYLGHAPDRLVDANGFIDTGDMVERRGDRYHFVGRRGGIINVGGLKVHPEEVEAVINRQPGVRMSLVRARKSPIMGAIVVADVVLDGEPPDIGAGPAGDALKDEIIRLCRRALPQHKVPAAIRFVTSLDVTTAGKLARHHA